ncbi:YagK/YfjJ domain-containing protein [Aeromonas caviae]|uniref:YagK/YfjJ domain-containing protein n=1 Tax=Aeromonas caviae TaxID=648 RepID=UPI0029D996F1|nr:inovirus-type Gp2 protein [Aeromonas caviae]MDX7704901.1 inovirus-type Gp2 protein [Aeromonas caviae]MDX7796853.1 inovirus-type Gp2 protein [Aeromonas caviae]
MSDGDELPSAVVARVSGSPKRKQGERYDYVTHRNEYPFAGIHYPINSAKSGCYTQILRRGIEQLTTMVSIYRRVLFIRFDLHHPQSAPTSEHVSAFIEAARKLVLRSYQTEHLGFLWVREQEKVQRQHYHLVLMLDGDKIRHPGKLLEALDKIWVRRGGTTSIPTKPYLFIDQPALLAEAVYRASYLAKARGKGFRPNGTRDFGCSRIKSRAP